MIVSGKKITRPSVLKTPKIGLMAFPIEPRVLPSVPINLPTSPTLSPAASAVLATFFIGKKTSFNFAISLKNSAPSDTDMTAVLTDLDILPKKLGTALPRIFKW